MPADNVWFSGPVDIDTAVGAVAEYFAEHDPDGYPRRALIVHNKSEVSYYGGPVLADYASNGNIGSTRGRGGEPGGPVLVLETDLKMLELGIKLADGRILGVTEHIPGTLAGWAAATGALDLMTGERDRGVPGDHHEILMDLKREGNNGYPTLKKSSAYATMTKVHIGKLKERGYDAAFVAGYLVASGIFASSAENLKKIYG
ncbi:Uncharacterised protein [Mycolicibacterium aurum]|uniref:Uncharacterized protein n=1 Tax=Mycolicibacterium aurum TaxID=1791 RepID=A0A3S4RWQ1_MYCAU|nr:Uncharacterised protein [Mycolicibacterium aurum]